MPVYRDHRRRLLGLARKMRREPTEAEQMLWSLLRGKQLDGFGLSGKSPSPVSFWISFASKQNWRWRRMVVNMVILRGW